MLELDHDGVEPVLNVSADELAAHEALGEARRREAGNVDDLARGEIDLSLHADNRRFAAIAERLRQSCMPDENNRIWTRPPLPVHGHNLSANAGFGP